MTEPIRLLLADDHPVVRAGLRAVLEAEADLRVVAESSTADEAVELVARGGVDVVLMDLQFGSASSGVRATTAITGRPDAPYVLILTNYDTEADILAAIEAGAMGYLLKDAPPDELASAVRAAAGGHTALARQVATRLTNRMRSGGTELSPREVEVLQLVAAGLSNEDIGRRLFLSRATVKTHLVHIYTKLDVDSRTAAVAAASERGIIRSW